MPREGGSWSPSRPTCYHSVTNASGGRAILLTPAPSPPPSVTLMELLFSKASTGWLVPSAWQWAQAPPDNIRVICNVYKACAPPSPGLEAREDAQALLLYSLRISPSIRGVVSDELNLWYCSLFWCVWLPPHSGSGTLPTDLHCAVDNRSHSADLSLTFCLLPAAIRGQVKIT